MNLDERKVLQRQIAGALKHVIKAQGPVTLQDVNRVSQMAAAAVAKQDVGYAPSSGALKTRQRRIVDLERRDGPGCFYCGTEVTEENFSIDHGLPRSRGGTRAFANLHLACRNCNNRKANRTMLEYARAEDVLPRVWEWLANHPETSQVADVREPRLRLISGG